MNPAKPTKAIIIAAGRGKRLMPYTDVMPKCLVPVAGRSILHRQLDALRAAGVNEIVIIRGYKGHVLESQDLGPGVRFVDNPDFAHNNVLQSLFYAAHDLHGPLYITYSDIVFTAGVVRSLMNTTGQICLVIDQDFAKIYEGRTEHPLSEAEVADLHDTGLVRRVGKRSLPPDEAWGEFIGLVKLSAEGTDWLTRAFAEIRAAYRGREQEPFQRAAEFRNAYLTDLLQHLIDAGRPVTPVGIRGSWREIDTVQDLTRADSLLGSAPKDWI